jgi:hypothetical protein
MTLLLVYLLVLLAERVNSSITPVRHRYQALVQETSKNKFQLEASVGKTGVAPAMYPILSPDICDHEALKIVIDTSQDIAGRLSRILLDSVSNTEWDAISDLSNKWRLLNDDTIKLMESLQEVDSETTAASHTNSPEEIYFEANASSTVSPQEFPKQLPPGRPRPPPSTAK